MKNSVCKFIAGAVAVVAMASGSSSTFADLSYSNDFEGYDAGVTSTLGDDGWLVGANVFAADGVTFQYDYFAFPAPNDGAAFSGVAVGEGGADQGSQQLNTFNDYNNANHSDGSGNIIDALLFRDIGLVDASDVGTTYRLTYDVKLGNLVAPTTASVFLKSLDATSFAETGISSVDTTSSTLTWNSGSVDFTIDSGMVGNIFQLGFSNRASNGDASGIFYDNLSISAIPEPTSAGFLAIVGLGLLVRRRRN